jgi:SOS regulatory protein LexA
MYFRTLIYSPMARPNNDPLHLAALQDYYAQHRLIPSYSAISALLGFRAKNAAASLVARLKAAGYLRQTPDKRLTPTERFFERVRSVTAVRAGLPEAVDATADMVSLDALLVKKPSLTFLMPIKGDSMQDAGLLEGDTIVCERRQRADVGDIVVAFINNEVTVKRLAKEGTRYVLKPENKAYPVLRPDPLEILGVVTGSYRSYQR